MAESKTVKAIADGFHLCFRRAGEVFDVPVEKTGSWFVDHVDPVSEPVDEPKPVKRPRQAKVDDLL